MERKYYSLSDAQRILFHSQKYAIYKQVNNICTLVLVDTRLDFDIFKKAIMKAYERNDSFRIRIVKVKGEMKQYFAEHEDPDIKFLDFTGKTREQMDKKLYRIARKKVTVYGKQMSKVYMIRSFDGKCGIYFVVSHLIMDSWAITTFFKDVLSIYQALSSGTDMPKPLTSYEELLIKELNYKNTRAYEDDIKFWRKNLDAGEPIFTHVNGSCVLERYRKKKKDPTIRYAKFFTLRTRANNVVFWVPKELVEKMSEYCTKNKVTMQSMVIMAFRSYYSKVNNREKDISFYTTVARRGTLAEKNSGGSRAHFYPFRTIFEEEDTFKKACQVISEKQTEVYRHAEVDPLKNLGIWKEMFNISHVETYCAGTITFQPVNLSSGEFNVESKWYGNGTSAQPLYLTVMDGDGTGALKFYYEYQTRNITLNTVRKLHSYMMKALKAAVENDEITVREVLDIE
ncbi:MAG: hypothetical protein GX854_12345 [Clostridiales bacterium]|nr:hypothetical protein [Clostridiales bacterium]